MESRVAADWISGKKWFVFVLKIVFWRDVESSSRTAGFRNKFNEETVYFWESVLEYRHYLIVVYQQEILGGYE